MSKRYIYVIGVTEDGLGPNVKCGPTLGAFTSARAANSHINRIIADRTDRYQAKVRWDLSPKWDYNGDSIREVHIENHLHKQTVEILRLQKYLM